MRRKASVQSTIRGLEAAAIVLAISNALIWHGVFAGGGRPDDSHRLALTPATGKTVPTADGTAGLLQQLLGTGRSALGPRPEDAGDAAVAEDAGSAAVAGPKVGERVGLPMRLKIPSIALDAAIEKVALAADGSMGVPKSPLDIGWYEKGPRPGETGSAAIAGHVDWANGAAAVLADLHKVKTGDKIAVEDDQGATIAFIVRKSRTYDANAQAVEVFRSSDGRAHLNIITCSGAWDKIANQYTKRLVVFADREM